MSSYSLASRSPITPPAVDTPEQPAELVISFWHPALPEVVDASGGCIMVARPFPRDGRFFVRAVNIAALLLCLSFPALAQESAAAPCKINVNAATTAQLVLLVQTGPSLAAKITDARAGSPLDAAKLDAVSGIGVKWLEYNGPYVAYDGPTTCETKLRKPVKATGEREFDTVRKEGNGGGR